MEAKSANNLKRLPEIKLQNIFSLENDSNWCVISDLLSIRSSELLELKEFYMNN